MKINTENTLLCIAHADDELITFGALVQTIKEQGHRLTVVCLTKSSNKRWRELQASSKAYGFELHCLNAIDDPEQEILDSHFVSEMGKLMGRLTSQRGRFTAVVTHDPRKGDLGCHLHHRSMGVLATLAAENIRPSVPVWYRFVDGFCAEPSVVALTTPESYHSLVSNIASIYPDELSNLEPEKYPIPSVMMFGTYARGVVKKIAMQMMTDHSISSHDLDILDSDPWNIKGDYETWKRDSVAIRLRKILQDNDVNMIVDIGCGIAQTWARVRQIHTRDFGFFGVDSPVYKSVIRETFGNTYVGYHSLIEADDDVKYGEPITVPITKGEAKRAVSFMQSIYYLQGKLVPILQQVKAPAVIIETGGDLDDWMIEDLKSEGYHQVSVSKGDPAKAFLDFHSEAASDMRPLTRMIEQINIYYYEKT